MVIVVGTNYTVIGDVYTDETLFLKIELGWKVPNSASLFTLL